MSFILRASEQWNHLCHGIKSIVANAQHINIQIVKTMNSSYFVPVFPSVPTLLREYKDQQKRKV
uniref:Uncharacterized protein n=1 Tax=Anguilla anguilla TaxID=7936 RepID=A0A0E9WR76_ANGAN